MRHSKPSALAIALVLACPRLASAQTAPLGIEVTTDSDAAQFVVQGEVQEARVEIFSPSGEGVFASDVLTGEVIRWNLRDEQGQRVADGVYLAALTVRTARGTVRKRVEQIMVSRAQQPAAQMAAPQVEAATITGAGTGTTTAGNLARFTGTTTIGNSVMQQSVAGNIGINRAPTAVLHVQNKAQPAPSASNGRNAPTLLQTSGGKGGNTTGAGTTGGRGASLSLVAGNGGNAVSGATNGDGGNITLQPGSAGTGGAGGRAGNVLLAPFAGNVGIGTTSPMRALQIGPSFDAAFTIEPSNGSPRAGFIRFGDNTGWQLHIGRSRQSSAGPLNTGTTGVIMTIQDKSVSGLCCGTVVFKASVQLDLIHASGASPLPLCRNSLKLISECSSSLRYKTDVKPFGDGLRLINFLQPVSFLWKADQHPDIGLIAEDVAKVEPRLTFRNEKGEIEGVKYELLPVVFVNAIKEQQKQLQQQQKLIEQLQSRLTRLESGSAQPLAANMSKTVPPAERSLVSRASRESSPSNGGGD